MDSKKLIINVKSHGIGCKEIKLDQGDTERVKLELAEKTLIFIILLYMLKLFMFSRLSVAQ